VVILGSTGSIGTQALQVIAAHPDKFLVVGLAAGGSRGELLMRQAADHPEAVIAVSAVSAGCVGALELLGRRVLAGPEAATDLVTAVQADVVLNAITGSVGLAPTMATLHAGLTLALANKESLVAGGSLVTSAARPGQIVPVDSEHSALAQCLRSGSHPEVSKLVLTASGGPFRGRTVEQLAGITVADALAHPTWAMGPVVTVNSATLVNKGLEVIEAHLLFDIGYHQIDVVVHPQSVVHSMVTFQDGSTIAQASPPDMRLPIALGLNWPNRMESVASPCDFSSATSWTFEPVDGITFPALGLARSAGLAGGLVPAVFNAANEQAVAAFLGERLTFTGISHILMGILEEADHASAEPGSISDVLAAQEWARARADELITTHSNL